MELKHEFHAHTPYALAMKFSNGGDTLITAGMDNVIHLWDTTDWSLMRTFEGHEKSSNTLALSPDERVLASGSSDQTVRLWSYPDGEALHVLQDRKKVVATVVISPDGKYVAAGSYGGRVMIWSLGGEAVLGFQAKKGHANALAISPDGLTLAIGGQGDDIQLREFSSGKEMGTLTGHQAAVWSLYFSKAGDRLYSYGYEAQIITWDLGSMSQVRAHKPEFEDMRGFVFSPDETRLAAPNQGQVTLLSAADYSELDTIPVGSKVVNGVAFSPDGGTLIASGGDGKLRVFQ